jgi:hypothetical protein
MKCRCGMEFCYSCGSVYKQCDCGLFGGNWRDAQFSPYRRRLQEIREAREREIDYNNPLILKNLLIIVSAFLFSFIISIFINNQKNGIEIISDNLDNYKSNYKLSKATQFEEERELKSLSQLINKTFKKTEIEIDKQKKRLKILQYCNWGISVALLLSIIIVSIAQIRCKCGIS